MQKRIAYDYLFNYFGDDMYEGKPVSGASILLNIRVYKGNEEILFDEDKEPCVNGKYLFHVFNISFDREELFMIKRNLSMDNLFRRMFNCDRIEAEIVKYSLDTYSGTVKNLDCGKEFPKEIQDMLVSESNIVSEEEFRAFLVSHKDDFDISDNKPAQVPSVAWLDFCT